MITLLEFDLAQDVERKRRSQKFRIFLVLTKILCLGLKSESGD